MRKVISYILCIIIFLNFPIFAKAEDVHQHIEDIIFVQSSGEGEQYWIDTTLSENAGISSEWYIFALHQYGNYDFSSYRNALQNYLDTHEIRSASSRLKYSLALMASGSESSYIQESLENSIGQQGIMSWIYGLHVMNNDISCESYSPEDAINYLLSVQLPDNGWALMGTVGDIDVTAMTIQSLAPYYFSDDAVRNACDNAVQFLSEHQLENGGYRSFGTENSESTAQVITALSALGIDAFSDERFIKNNYTLLDAMEGYCLPDGTFSHTPDGGFNEVATIQAFYTFVAYTRMQNGQSPLYVLDKISASSEETELQTEPETIPEIIQETESQVFSEIESPTESEFESSSETTLTSETEITTTTTLQTSSESSVFSSEMKETSSLKILETTLLSNFEEITQTQTTITETVLLSSEHPEQQNSPAENWKIIAICIILGSGLLACLMLFLFKKRNFKNFLFVGIVVVITSGIVLFIKIETPETYYQSTQKENQIGSVMLTIRCDTLLGKGDSEYIPQDGVILEMTEFPLSEGDTVYDILTEAVQSHHIQMEHGTNYYISGINYLYEMQYGDLSGWMYRVNGEFPSVGCGEYFPKDGDIIEWLYSCDIGNDLN